MRLVFVLLFLRKTMALVMLVGSLVLALFMRLVSQEVFLAFIGVTLTSETLNHLAAIMRYRYPQRVQCYKRCHGKDRRDP